jgi:hypothetical protein
MVAEEVLMEVDVVLVGDMEEVVVVVEEVEVVVVLGPT